MEIYDGDDRVRQVSVLRDWVADIVFGSDDPSTSAGDRVAYFVQHYEEQSGEPLPSWFDDVAFTYMVKAVAVAESL